MWLRECKREKRTTQRYSIAPKNLTEKFLLSCLANAPGRVQEIEMSVELHLAYMDLLICPKILKVGIVDDAAITLRVGICLFPDELQVISQNDD